MALSIIKSVNRHIHGLSGAQDIDKSAGQDKKIRVVVGIPAYNEEVAIGSIVLRSLKHADKVAVLDDCSKDHTMEVARLAGATVLAHDCNEGKGASLKDIFKYASDSGADALVLLDGDGQHDPDEIPGLLEPIINGQADMVIGSRFIKMQSNVPFYRRIGQETLTLATNAVSGTGYTDSQSGYRAFSRRTFSCFSFKNNGMGIESEMLIEAAGAGIRIVEVPVRVRYDVDGSTFNPIAHGVSVLNYLIRLMASRKPLLFFGLPGFILLCSGGVFMYLALDVFNATRSLSPAYVLTSAFCIILGAFCAFNAMTLMSLKNITVKTRQ